MNIIHWYVSLGLSRYFPLSSNVEIDFLGTLYSNFRERN